MLIELRVDVEALKQSRNRRSRPNNGQCFKCGKQGHFKRNCPSTSDDTAGKDKVPAYTNIGTGYQQEEAGMYITARLNGMETDLLVDTGATVTMLSINLFRSIPPDRRPNLNHKKRCSCCQRGENPINWQGRI